jgi:hypothetical protein
MTDLRVGLAVKFLFGTDKEFLAKNWSAPEVSRINGDMALISYLGKVGQLLTLHVWTATGLAVGDDDIRVVVDEARLAESFT